MEIHVTKVKVLTKNFKIIKKLNTFVSFSQEPLLQVRCMTFLSFKNSH